MGQKTRATEAQGPGHATQLHSNDRCLIEELDRGVPVSFLLGLLSRSSSSYSFLLSLSLERLDSSESLILDLLFGFLKVFLSKCQMLQWLLLSSMTMIIILVPLVSLQCLFVLDISSWGGFGRDMVWLGSKLPSGPSIKAGKGFWWETEAGTTMQAKAVLCHESGTL